MVCRDIDYSAFFILVHFYLLVKKRINAHFSLIAPKRLARRNFRQGFFVGPISVVIPMGIRVDTIRLMTLVVPIINFIKEMISHLTVVCSEKISDVINEEI